MHLKPDVAASPFHKHFSSLLENDLSGWNEFHMKTESKSYANNRTQAQNFLHRRKSITVQSKRPTVGITSRYMDRSLYIPKSPPKKVVKKLPASTDLSYSFIRKKSISQLEKLMRILETRTTSQSVDLPKLVKSPNNTKPLKSQETSQKTSKIFSKTLLKFYKLRNP